MRLDLRMASDRLMYDAAKHYLGVLCKRGHGDVAGQSWRHIGHGNCVDCTREGARKWKAANPDRAAINTKRRDMDRSCREQRRKYPIAHACSSAKKRAREFDVPCDISPDSLRELWKAQGGMCYWTGLDLSFDYEADRHPLKPSIDRLVPSDGYTVGNVVWASNFANRARSDCPAGEFWEIMTKLEAAYNRRKLA